MSSVCDGVVQAPRPLEATVGRTIYDSRGRQNRRTLARLVALIIVICAAALGGLYAVEHASGRDGGTGASKPAALTAPAPEPLRNVRVHRKRRVTLAYRVANQGEAIRSVTIIIRRASGRVAATLGLGPQPPDRRLSHRFRVRLKTGRYTWFVRATGADGVTRTSPQGDSLVVRAPLPRLFPASAAIASAVAYLQERNSDSAIAVVDTRGVLHGHNLDKQFTSASVIKAMLLVEYLRTHASVPADIENVLTLMITQSDNAAAFEIFGIVGAKGLEDLAHLAGMKHLRVGEDVIFSRITAADQARFFFHMDEYVPPAHRALARYLLSHIIATESWGIPQVARPDWRVFFKGGWFGAEEDPFRIVNQVARLERGKLKWSVAVLSDENPHSPYGVETLEGVTQRLLAASPESESD